MGKVTTQFTMSLDGYIADPNDGVDQLFRWYTEGDTPLRIPGVPREFKVSAASRALLDEVWANVGAIVTGRRDFEVSKAWGGQSPFNVPIFIVTHSVPQEWVRPDVPFTFVTNGVEHAIALGREAAGDKEVSVGGTQVVQQALRAGLIDEIQIDLAPLLLGAGIRLFDSLPAPVDLEYIGVTEGKGVVHLRYRVVR